MAFFYVKSGFGTRVAGGGTTSQTGSMATLGAANVYADVPDAITDGAGAGDFILCSDLHSASHTANVLYSGPQSGDFLTILSVDDLNIDQEKAGAKEATTTGFLDIFGSGQIVLNIDIGVTGGFGPSASAQIKMTGSTITFGTSTASTIEVTGGGQLLELNNCGLAYQADNAFGFNLRNGVGLNMFGGSITNSGTGNVGIIRGGFGGGGATANIIGVDVSAANPSYLVALVGASAQFDDLMQVLFDGCKLNAGLTGFVEETLANLSHKVTVVNSSSDSAAAEFQFFENTRAGTAEDQDSTGIYKVETTTYESGEQTSLQITTNSTCSVSVPLVFDIPPRFAKLSTGAEDTLTVYLAVVDTVTLTDALFWIEVLNPNGTSKNLWDYDTTRAADILSTGTTLTDDSGSSVWEDNGVDLTGYNEYRIDVPISGGADSYPIIRAHCGEPSLAGTLYVSPVIGVS